MKTNKLKVFGLLTVFLFSLIAVMGVVSALDVVKVEINGKDMTDVDNLKVERGETLEIEFKLQPADNLTDVVIGTYEYANEEEGTFCGISRFDVDAGDTEFKTCTVTVP